MEYRCGVRTVGEILALGLFLRVSFVTGVVRCNGVVCGYGTVCGTSTCDCASGYTGLVVIQQTYPPVVYCLQSCSAGEPDCPVNNTCKEGSVHNTYRCVCSPGAWRSNTTGQCLDIDECRRNPGICGNNSVCINHVGNFTCRCEDGYTLHEGGGAGCVKDPPNTESTEETENPSPSVPVSSSVPRVPLHSVPRVPFTSAQRVPPTSVPRHPPTSAKTSTNKDRQGLVIGLSAGIGGAVLLTIFVVVIVVVIRRNERRKNTGTNEVNGPRLRKHEARSGDSKSRVYTSVLDPPLPGHRNNGNASAGSVISSNNQPVVRQTRPLGDSSPYVEVDLDNEPNPYAVAGSHQQQVAASEDSESRGSPVNSKVSITPNQSKLPFELYSNHKIPQNKAKQKKEKHLNVDENQQNNYNTLYELAFKSTNKSTRDIQCNETGTGNNDGSVKQVAEESPYSVAGLIVESALTPGATTEKRQGPSDGEYDELKLQRV